MQDLIAERLPTAVSPRGKALDAAWTAPLGTGRLFALLFLTGGAYSLFYVYKIARDLRDHADGRITPWLYPPSILIGLANAIAGGRLASMAASLASSAQRKPSCSGGTVGGLIFVAHIIATLSGTVISEWWWIVFLLLYAVPWLLIERQLTAIKVDLPNANFRSKPLRFTKWQWVAMALGIGFWALMLVALQQEVARFRGTELAVGARYEDPLGRFSLTSSVADWVIVAPGTVGEDAELELLGPGSSDWAVLHVTEQAGWTLDRVVENRYAEISAIDEAVEFSERRELAPGKNIALSYTTYRGRDAIDGPFAFYATTFVTEQRVVELIVYTAGVRRALSGAEALAHSLEPPGQQVGALEQ